MLLVTRPRHDEANYYLYHWSENFIQEAKRKSIEVIDLGKDRATKKKLESYLRKQSPQIIIFNGHGDSDSIAGHEDEPLIIKNHNTELLKNKNVFIRACDAGRALGPDIVEKGANGFVGYKEKFMFPCDKNNFRTPLEDKLASPCLECSNQVGVSLIKGHSTQEAHEMSLKIYKKKLDEMKTSESGGNSLVRACLVWNMINQISL